MLSYNQTSESMNTFQLDKLAKEQVLCEAKQVIPPPNGLLHQHEDETLQSPAELNSFKDIEADIEDFVENDQAAAQAYGDKDRSDTDGQLIDDDTLEATIKSLEAQEAAFEAQTRKQMIQRQKELRERVRQKQLEMEMLQAELTLLEQQQTQDTYGASDHGTSDSCSATSLNATTKKRSRSTEMLAGPVSILPSIPKTLSQPKLQVASECRSEAPAKRQSTSAVQISKLSGTQPTTLPAGGKSSAVLSISEDVNSSTRRAARLAAHNVSSVTVQKKQEAAPSDHEPSIVKETTDPADIDDDSVTGLRIK
eukprot:jgi/Hompol1/2121/HPOL_005867-RA